MRNIEPGYPAARRAERQKKFVLVLLALGARFGVIIERGGGYEKKGQRDVPRVRARGHGQMRVDGGVLRDAGDVERAKDKFTTGYECAMADGVCREVTDDAEKLHALRLIAEKYTPEHLPAFDDEVAASLARTGVYAIELTGITGKAKILKK